MDSIMGRCLRWRVVRALLPRQPRRGRHPPSTAPSTSCCSRFPSSPHQRATASGSPSVRPSVRSRPHLQHWPTKDRGGPARPSLAPAILFRDWRGSDAKDWRWPRERIRRGARRLALAGCWIKVRPSTKGAQLAPSTINLPLAVQYVEYMLAPDPSPWLSCVVALLPGGVFFFFWRATICFCAGATGKWLVRSHGHQTTYMCT